ncbi:MAG: class I SAM-dependent RNA methyltransferase [Verrucomicrobia bacterium]|nr:class I SAM-dependent RNA methyltransferase [Verrucomicrobiota bacterium]
MNNISTCPHFAHCSGCAIPLEETPPIWESALEFFKKFSIYPSLQISKSRHWRLKAKLAVRGTHDNPIIGLFKEGTHEAISIPHCQVHHPSINQAVEIVRQAIQESKISIYNDSSGLLRYLQFFVERETGKIQLTLILNAEATDPTIDRFCQNLLQLHPWHSLWINFNPQKSNRILSSSWQKIFGSDRLTQSIKGIRIPFHPGAFAQAHLDLFEVLLQTVNTWVPPNSRIVELFAGVGVIGLSLLQNCQKLLLIENNPFAEIPSLPKCSHLIQDANLFDDFDSYDVAIVDPPRKGLGPTLLKKLSQAKKLRLIYISCGFESFQRDCLELTAAGWSLKQAEGFLLFPGTNHVETAALFEIS